jgi:hypothetical protein
MTRYFPIHPKDAERLISLTIRQARVRFGHDLLAGVHQRTTRALMAWVKRFPETEIVAPDGNKVRWSGEHKEWYYLEY